MTSAKPRIVVTGASGFAGRNLSEYLMSQGYTVYPVRRQDVDLLDETAVKQYLDRIDFDIVLHCATVGGTRKTGYDEKAADVVEINLRMFFNIERCLKTGQRLINFGSGAEYDHRHYQPKMTEKYFGRHIPKDAYGFSKYAISQLIASRTNILCLRIFGLFGPYEDYRYKFISNAVVKSLSGLPIVINQDVVFDYLYVADFVRIVERLLTSDWPYRHMNITPTESARLSNIAGVINESAEIAGEIRILHAGLNTEYTGNNQRLIEVIGAYGFIPLRQAIGDLRRYYQQNMAILDLEAIRQDSYLAYCRTTTESVDGSGTQV